MSDESANMTAFDDDLVRSPCISVCKMDPGAGDDVERAAGGLCVGCLRTLDEIVEWGTATDDRKAAIVRAVERRRDRSV